MRCVIALTFLMTQAHVAPKYESLRIGSFERRYVVDVPANLAPGFGLVLVSHSFGGTALGIRRDLGLTKVMDHHKFLIVYLEGLPDKQGNPNFEVGYQFQPGKVDDAGYAKKVAEKVIAQYQLNPKAIFATGFSNGGDLSFYLARQKTQWLRAVAPLSGCMMTGWDQILTTTNPVSIMAVNGRADQTTRWFGDPANKDGWGAYLGVQQVADWWIKGLSLDHKEETSGDEVERTRWSKLGSDIEYILYTVPKGDHRIFEHLQDPDRPISEEILSFFERHWPG